MFYCPIWPATSSLRFFDPGSQIGCWDWRMRSRIFAISLGSFWKGLIAVNVSVIVKGPRPIWLAMAGLRQLEKWVTNYNSFKSLCMASWWNSSMYSLIVRSPCQKCCSQWNKGCTKLIGRKASHIMDFHLLPWCQLVLRTPLTCCLSLSPPSQSSAPQSHGH